MEPREVVAAGLLPKELPPSFHASSFADVLPEINDDLALPDDGNAWKQHAEATPFSIPLSLGRRRHLAIPNPRHGTQLLLELCARYEELRKFNESSQFSISTIRFGDAVQQKFSQTWRQSRGLAPVYPFRAIAETLVQRGMSDQWVVRADVSRCYDSIYTHAMAWALDGHDARKQDLTKPGGRLDRLLQRCNDNQTHGILIGPDASFVAAEILLTAVDQRLASVIPECRGVRFYDDYFLLCKTREEAEASITALAAALRIYGLELNEGKTRILRLPMTIGDEWARRLRFFQFRKTDAGQRADVLEFIGVMGSLARDVDSSEPIAYGLQVLGNERIHVANSTTLQQALAQVASSYPEHLHLVEKWLQTLSENGHDVDHDVWREAIEAGLSRIGSGHEYEAAWWLWIARAFRIEIDLESSLSMPLVHLDEVSSVVALDLREAGLCAFEGNPWAELHTLESLEGRGWLRTYEGEVHGWIAGKDGKKYSKHALFFCTLYSKEVKFYDGTRKSEPFAWPQEAAQAVEPAAPAGTSMEQEDEAVGSQEEEPVIYTGGGGGASV